MPFFAYRSSPMDIHGTLATELPEPSQLLHHYSVASAVKSNTRPLWHHLIGTNNYPERSRHHHPQRQRQRPEDEWALQKESVSSNLYSGPRDCHIAVRSSLMTSILFHIRRNLLKNCFFLIENQLFSHFLNTILHYWTVKLLKIFKNLN